MFSWREQYHYNGTVFPSHPCKLVQNWLKSYGVRKIWLCNNRLYHFFFFFSFSQINIMPFLHAIHDIPQLSLSPAVLHFVLRIYVSTQIITEGIWETFLNLHFFHKPYSINDGVLYVLTLPQHRFCFLSFYCTHPSIHRVLLKIQL